LGRSISRNIADAILSDLLHSGQVQQGDKLPPVRELERRYNVSRATIVHALGLLEQQGWINRRQGSGCYVARRAGERPTAQNLMGFIARNTNSEVILRVYAGIERIARLHGFNVLVASSDDSYTFERQQVDNLIRAGCAAIVLFPVTRTEAELREDYLKREFTDFPIVLVDIAYPEQKRSQVVFDNYLLGYEMTEMLLREGHRRIAFMDIEKGAQPFMHYSTRERYRGYLDALRHAGISPDPEDHWVMRSHLPGEDMIEEVEPFLRRWQQMDSRPSAVIAIEDFCAIHTIQLAKHLGIRVPEELTVVGFDNLSVARNFHPAFPTSDPDFRRAGEIAARLALQLARGTLSEPVIYMLPVSIKRRKVATADQRVLAVAIEHI
jgi:GntR family transcriptional regulator of arabinose operon